METTDEFDFQINHSELENEVGSNGKFSKEISSNSNVTSFENISFFIATHKYPTGLNLNQKRTLRKAATNFSLIENKLYYVGKSKTDKRLVILDEDGKKQVFEDCHGSTSEGGHGGQKKTLEKIESFFFWRGMVKDVVNWIAACEICRQKEERRSQLCKKIRTIDSISETINHSPDVCLDDAFTCSENSHDDLYEAAKHNVEQIQFSLQKILHYEKEIVNMSKKADLDIDDVLDFLLAKIMKLISRKKREMKAQVEEQKTRSLNALNTSRKQLEGRFKTARKFVLDVEKAANSNQPWATPLNKSAITASLPEVPLKENLGGIWSVFYADEAHTEIEKIIMSCGTICEQSPYKISNVLQLPASLRLNISNVQSDYRPLFKETYESPSFAPTRSLRLYHRLHNPAAVTDDDFVLHENQIRTLECFSRDAEVFLNCLQTCQVYAIYISYREEGSSEWSPWSFPFLTSTLIPGFSWEIASSDWQISSDQRATTKITDSPTPIYSSSAQYFPGCCISFTLEEIPTILHADDGFALIDQGVQGGTLNQEGTLFVNVEGKIFVDGKFIDKFDPLSLVSSTLRFDCHPHIEKTADGIRMELTISCQKQSHLIYWSVRNHITNIYFGARFHQPGARVTIG